MLLEKKARFFLEFDLAFRAVRNSGDALPFRAAGDELDVETVLQEAIKAGAATLTLKNEDVASLTLLEVRDNDHMAVLLFRRSNPDAGTPIFEHRRTRKLRKSDKTEDESVSVSAHLFVDLDERPGLGFRYRALLEEVPGLGRSYIESIVGRVLREQKYVTQDRGGDDKETYCVVDFLGVKSETLKNALEDGTVSAVELVRPAKLEGLDTDGLIAPKDERMKLTVKATPAQSLGLIRRIRTWATSHNWNDVRVQIRMPEDRSRVVSVTREVDAADTLFVRAEQVTVATELDVCTEVIVDELVAKARELFDRP